jgi:DNA topoisomerase I
MSEPLRRSDPWAPGIRRRRRGRGFTYLDRSGVPIRDRETLARIRRLAIPPAWEDVWISPDARGHLQAVGTDGAGRRQYRYHEAWIERRGHEKYRRMEGFARSLPALRQRVERDLRRPGISRERVLAGAVRLLDRGAVRIGGEEYLRRNGSFGLATLRRDQAKLSGDAVVLSFTGKSGRDHQVRVRDPAVVRLVRALKRATVAEELLIFRNGDGWHDVRSDDINAYLKESLGDDYSAKDFRTWSATVLAASKLAEHDPSEGIHAVREVVREVATTLGNSPAVARSSYIDPRVIDRFLDEGRSIASRTGGRESVERAVLRLLSPRPRAARRVGRGRGARSPAPQGGAPRTRRRSPSRH